MKKIMLLGLVFLISLSSVYGAFTDNQIHVYDFTTDFTDSVGSVDFSEQGGTIPNTASGGDFEAGDSEYLQASQVNLVTGSGDDDFTFALTFTPETLSGTQILYDEHGTTGIILRITDVGGGTYKLNSWVDNTAQSWNTALSNGVTYDLVWTYDDGTDDHYFYLNNNSGDGSYNFNVPISTNTIIRFGSYAHTTGSYYDGYIKEVCMWDRVISSDEITEFMSYGCSGEPSSTPSLTINTDLVNNTINYNTQTLNFVFNGSLLNQNTDYFNVSFYENGEFKTTLLNVNITKNNIYNITFPANYTGYYNISFNASNYELSDDSGVYYYNVDLLAPFITTTFINNSQYYLEDIVNVWVNFSDENLYAYNVTIFKPDGSVHTNNFLENIITSSIINETNITVLNGGNWSVLFQTWDSHTAINVSEINWYWENNKLYAGGLIFEGDIKDVNNKGNLVTYFYKDFDRYKLQATFDDQSLSHSVNITAPGWVYVGDRYGYKGHFVSLLENKWLDFMGDNIDTVTVNPLGNDRYQIDVTHFYETDEILFESIGDLNTKVKGYSFNVDNSIEISSLSNTIRTNDTITLNWTVPNNYNYAELTRDDYLVYNGSLYGYTDTSLNGSTSYFYELTAYYNSTIFDYINISISTLQNPIVPNSNNYICPQNDALTEPYCAVGGIGYYYCDGSWNSNYPCTNVYDDDYNTYGLPGGIFGGTGTLYINYTIPAQTIGAWWEVKGGGKNLQINFTNYTISQNCLTLSTLQLRLESVNSLIDNDQMNLYCYNTTGWEYVYNHPTADASLTEDSYEEQIIWFINKTFTFSFFDEENSSVINNVNMNIITNDYSFNDSTLNGVYTYLSNATAGTTEIRYNAEGYKRNFYYFNVYDMIERDISLYLLNENQTLVNFYIYDEFGSPVSNVTVLTYRYYLNNNSYAEVGQRITNFEGKAILNLELDTEKYYFVFMYNNQVKKITEPSFIDNTNYYFTINIGQNALETYYDINKIQYSLLADNDDLYFRYFYFDPESTIQGGCLKVYRNNITDRTLVNSSCSTLYTNTITLYVDNRSNTTYIGVAEIQYNDLYYVLNTRTIQIKNIFAFGLLGVFLTFFLTLMFTITVLISSNSIEMTLSVMGLPLILMSIIGFIDLSIYYAIGVEVGLLILSYIVSKRML